MTALSDPCPIVRDLLPLYAEGLASPASARLVEEHLAQCEDCRAELKALRTAPAPTPEEGALMAELAKKLRARRNKLIGATALAVLLALILALTALTTPIYLPRAEALAAVGSDSGQGVTVTFTDRVADYALESLEEGEEAEVTCLSAWTTLGHRLLGRQGRTPLYIPWPEGRDAALYYSGNDAREAELLLSRGAALSGGFTVLPRLVLNYYALLALAAALLLGPAYFLLRRHPRLWAQLLLAPLCYLAGHGLVVAWTGSGYAAARSFGLILLTAACLYGLLSLGLSLLLGRREIRKLKETL